MLYAQMLINDALDQIEKPKATIAKSEMEQMARTGAAIVSQSDSSVYFAVGETYVWDAKRNAFVIEPTF